MTVTLRSAARSIQIAKAQSLRTLKTSPAEFRFLPSRLLTTSRNVSLKELEKTPTVPSWFLVNTVSLPKAARYSTSTITMSTDQPESNGDVASKPVLFFDIDNCLYPRSSKVQDHMAELIDKYFAKHLSLSWDDAVKLHKEYYTNYGLAIEGLVRHHQIDPLEYNAQVDDALPLETILKPNPEVRQLLEDIDLSKVRLWLLTNAYVTHGRRVVRLLGVDDMFEGLTFCDYGQQPLVCKPAKEMYLRAQQEAGVERAEDCFFVDDSYLNCKKAQEYGWTVAHLVEEDLPVPETPACNHQIRHLRELRDVYPQFFKSRNS